MKFTAVFSIASVAVCTVSAGPLAILPRDVDVIGLLPAFWGVNRGTPFPGMPPNTDCLGVNNARIPCNCPFDIHPVADKINQALRTGKVPNNPTIPNIEFPTGNSNREQAKRLNAVLVIQQNFFDAGKGCPAVSTDFVQRIAALGGA